MEGNIVPVHAMKAYRRSTAIAALVVKLGTRARRVAKFMPQALYPRY
jgi:hypothetical protein